MINDDLLFPVDHLNRWKLRQLPDDWMTKQSDALLARMRAQAAKLQKNKTVFSAASAPHSTRSHVLIAPAKPAP